MSLSSLNSIGQTVFKLEYGNENVDGQTDGHTNGQKTNRRNFTNFERNLAMMLIYLPVTFEFDRTNRFRVRVRKQKIGQGLLLTGDPHVVAVPPKYFFHAINVQQLIYVLYNNKCKIKKNTFCL